MPQSIFRLRAASRGLAAALAVSAFASLPARVAAQEPKQEPKLETTTLRYQSAAGADVNPLELADALGYLKPLTLQRLGDVQGGPAALQATATGQTDIAIAFNGAVLNVAAAGAPLTALISWRGTSESTSDGLFALDSGGVSNARDLIGKKIGVNTLGANAEAVTDGYLTKGGLSRAEIKQVTYVPLPSPNLEQALRNGQIAAASLSGIFRDAALARGGIKPLHRNVELFGTYSDNTAVFRNDFIRKNPNTTRHLIGALAKTIAWIQQRQQPKDRPEVIGLYKKYLESTGRGNQTESLAYWRGLGIATEGGWIRKREFEMWLPWLQARGEVDPAKLDLRKIYSNEFNPYWDGKED